MQVSNEGISHLKKVEGFRNSPYLDTANVPTIGFGFTYYPSGKRVTMNDSPITLNEAIEILKVILAEFEQWVCEKVIQPINQNQFDALVSFCYNVGKGAFNTSTLLKKVNNNPCDPTIEDEFKRWVYSGGKKTKGLKKRRNMESYLYFK